jgi:hypothetical protein
MTITYRHVIALLVYDLVFSLVDLLNAAYAIALLAVNSSYLGGGNVKVSFALLNWIHNSKDSRILFEKREIRKSPFAKGDLEGFSPAQQHFDETLSRTGACVIPRRLARH